MTKQDLRTGMVVELRNGEVYQVFLNAYSTYENNQTVNTLVDLDEAHWETLNNYRDNLTHVYHSELDVMGVYKSGFYTDVVKPSNYKSWKYTWVRKETKELTVKEIEKLLGYPVKIVKE
jgi:hypothetical protein